MPKADYYGPKHWGDVRCPHCGAKVDVPKHKRRYLTPNQIDATEWCYNCEHGAEKRAMRRAGFTG